MQGTACVIRGVEAAPLAHEQKDCFDLLGDVFAEWRQRILRCLLDGLPALG